MTFAFVRVDDILSSIQYYDTVFQIFKFNFLLLDFPKFTIKQDPENPQYAIYDFQLTKEEELLLKFCEFEMDIQCMSPYIELPTSRTDINKGGTVEDLGMFKRYDIFPKIRSKDGKAVYSSTGNMSEIKLGELK